MSLSPNVRMRWRVLLPALVLLLGVGFTASVTLASPPAQPAQHATQAHIAAPLTTYTSTDVPKILTGTVTSALTITDVSLISTIDVVGLTIKHTFPGDLNVYLISPVGTRVQLFNNVCGGIDWTDTNTGFTLSDGALTPIGETCPPGNGSYKPVGALAAFNGQPVTGVWQLEITDTSADEDTGQLTNWGLAVPGGTPQPTAVATTQPTLVPTVTITACPVSFTDVHPGDYFYEGVRYLYCKGAITGYSDNTFRPYNQTTRQQMTKIVVLGLDVPLFPPPATPSFTDVPTSNVFYKFIEAGKQFGIVSGYADRTFQPAANVTRGQLTKMVMVAKGVDLINPATPSFTDVPRSDVFYQAIETAVCYGIISGYNDRTFRPGNPALRGQIAKIVYLANVNTTGCAVLPTPLPQPQP